MTSPGKEQILAAQARALGTADSWHGKITAEGPFTPEVGRYRLYIGMNVASCLGYLPAEISTSPTVFLVATRRQVW